MKSHFLILLIAAVTSATAFQKTEPPTPVFGASTRLVQVNVVALDKNGKPVTDLRKEDFALFEDGKPQTTAIFVPEQSAPFKPPVLAPNEFSNQLPGTSSTRSGYTLILIDWLNSGAYTRLDSSRQVLKLLKQVEVNDLVSLCILDRGLRVLHDFTADRAELVRKLAATFAGMSEAPPEAVGSIGVIAPSPEVDVSPVFDRANSRNARFLEIRRSLDTIAALDQIASYLSAAPGRKSLIWVTSGFPSAIGYDIEQTQDLEAWSSTMSAERRGFSPEINNLLRRFNDANIGVYPVDARGVIAGKGAYINLAAMKEIAARTGGRAYYNDNDLDGAIRGALDDMRFLYMLGYYPTNRDNDGKYRNISVKVLRPGVTLRYRTGYQAEPSDKSRKAAPKIDLQQVLGSPLDATALPLNAHAVNAGGKLDVQLRIEPSSLTLRHENGRRRGSVSVYYAFRSEDRLGKIQVFSASNKLDFPEELYAKLLQLGPRTFRKQLSIPRIESLRLVVGMTNRLDRIDYDSTLGRRPKRNQRAQASPKT